MLIALILLSLVIVASTAVNVVVVLRLRDPLRARVLQRLVVTPSDDSAFSGVLREVGRGRDGHVVFSDCEMVETKQAIAGDVLKSKSSIVTYQVLHAAG